LTDFATLVLAADSRSLLTGEQALQKIAATAEQTESRTTKATSSLSKGYQEVGRQSVFASQQMRMSAMQLSQVAQQASVTGNWLQALAIQLPDLALGFGPIGIAAGAAAGAILAYWSTYDIGQNANDILRDQELLIGRVAERWGEAYPAIQKYNDELDRAREQSELISAIDIIKADQLKDVGATIEELRINLADFESMLQAGGEEPELIIAFRDAVESAIEKLEQGEDATGDLQRATGILSSDIQNTANPAIGSMITMLGQLALASQQTAIAVANVVNSAASIQSQLQNTIQGSSFKDADGKIRSPSNFTPLDPATPESRGTPELSGFPWEKFGASSRGGGAKGRKGGKSEAENYDSIVEAANRRIASLKAEYEAIGMTEEAAEKLRQETDLFNDAQQKGITLTDAQRANLSTLAETMANVEQQTKAAKEQQDFFSDVAEDVKSGFIDSIVEGEKLSDTFKDIGKSIAKAALEAALFGSGPFAGGAGGGGGYLGGIFKLFSFDGGGSTGPGSRSGGVDGKGGFPALLHPNETVIDHTKGGGAGQLASKIEVVSRFDANGNFESNVERISTRVSGDAVQRGIGQYDKGFENRLNQAMERTG